MKNPLPFIILLLHNHFTQWTHCSQNNTDKFSTWDYFPRTHVHGQTSCCRPQEAPIGSSSALWNTSPTATRTATDFPARLHCAPGISQDPGPETHHRMESVLRFSLPYPFISGQAQNTTFTVQYCKFCFRLYALQLIFFFFNCKKAVCPFKRKNSCWVQLLTSTKR